MFRGTNLWILILAIFVASLGLNINSTAVIIGAMLISPLMGPIMGIGLGMGINDINLLKKAVYNFAMATGVALTTSTLFFLVSPIHEAHSEILARTSPTIYDTLIALFGGFAGIVAVSSKQKGNVIPGVAIATALMPPLCTAGYGLATFQLNYFYGAFYLYIINTVFIALATFIIVRGLHFPHKHVQNKNADQIANRIVWGVVLITLIPSIYFGYDMVQQIKFSKNATRFITKEAHFTNDYLLNKKIDAKEKMITLVFGGKEISTEEIKQLKNKLNLYDLGSAGLEVKQGFAYLAEGQDNKQTEEVATALAMEQLEAKNFRKQMDSLNGQERLHKQVYAEIKSQYPYLRSAIIQPSVILEDSNATHQTLLIVLSLKVSLNKAEKMRLENWLKVRMNQQNLKLIFQ